jgi:hypothetical protein
MKVKQVLLNRSRAFAVAAARATAGSPAPFAAWPDGHVLAESARVNGATGGRHAPFATSPICDPAGGGHTRSCAPDCPFTAYPGSGEAAAGLSSVPGYAGSLQNGIPRQDPHPGAALYLHNGRGLAAYTHDDVF